MKKKLDRVCYLLVVTTQDAALLQKSVDEMIINTFSPLLLNLKTGNEQMLIHLGRIKCHDALDVPHTCLADIKLTEVKEST